MFGQTPPFRRRPAATAVAPCRFPCAWTRPPPESLHTDWALGSFREDSRKKRKLLLFDGALPTCHSERSEESTVPCGCENADSSRLNQALRMTKSFTGRVKQRSIPTTPVPPTQAASHETNSYAAAPAAHSV